MRRRKPYAPVRPPGPPRLFVLAVLCAALGACGTGGQGESTPRAAVDAYVAGLNARDADALARLAPPGNDARQDIVERLAADGGRDIRLGSVSLADDITPDVVTARLEGEGGGGPYRERLTVARCGEHWCVVLGQAPSNRTPAGTTRSR
ncbi:hypothetical protein [Streptosporangium saharense]|uniref:hypothetical protein n=1 Tax=Streptosporangium saharense TaxID=1706840 RepID=UPI003330C6A2